MTTSWNENLQHLLSNQFGAKEGKHVADKYNKYFPSSYSERCSPEQAIADLLHMAELSASNPLKVDFYHDTSSKQHSLRLKLFQFSSSIPLSDVLPMLENMGLRTLNEYPYEISFGEKESIWISDFSVIHANPDSFNIAKANTIFQDAFTNILAGQCENDGFNKLVLDAKLSWREVSIIRAYAKYVQQTRFRFSQAYIEKTFANHAGIAKNLVVLFKLKHDPQQTADTIEAVASVEAELKSGLEKVTSLDEDRILHRFWDLINATLRTNYFQSTGTNQHKNYIAFKFDCSAVPNLPLPKPLYEIFIYSARFEGIHLRGSKVARGGIRWSDRREDFRTEVLGLMKAQKVKNAVIVPSGAKGGFVLKHLPPQANREQVQAEVVACYKLFIHGLLDLTDNIVNNQVVRPPAVVCYDDEDSYLVVAADKGTATFSDTANAISKEFNFWLGDAFASGGSAGYDHKKMGITARGAWESIKRHLRELDLNIETNDIMTVGVGDMSGDVFGNGMLYSKHIKLVAAFDHRHIFIDPNPDIEKAYWERQRLFNLPTSSWEDYNAELLSHGGGIFKRSSKSITLSSEAMQVLGITDSALAPNELIRAILKAPVDLLFNGGIGTYVKSVVENHADVGDKTNEFTRINGNELRCKIVGEGGNLGFTQLGRVEYALNNGLINTDFIDNSAGVDCSDHEVNIKILLNEKVANGTLTEENRNELLASMTNEVGDLVLRDNYSQALVMSFSAAHSASYSNLYLNHIKKLESAVSLDRAVEFLPDDKLILERKAQGNGLTRPELAVLLAYTKIHLKKEILKSTLPEDNFFISMLQTAFPATLLQSYYNEMTNHHLHREIIATQVSNYVVNSMGITYAYRLQAETGASIAEIARAQIAASTIYGATELQQQIALLDYKIPVVLQYELLHHMRYLLNLASRWFLRNNRLEGDLEAITAHYRERILILADIIPELIVGTTRGYLQSLNEQFTAAGLPTDIAKRVATSRVMFASLNITEIATMHNFDLIKTAKVYFEIGRHFALVGFRDLLAKDNREGETNSLARLTLRDDLDTLQRSLCIVILKSDQANADIEHIITHWAEQHPSICKRWEEVLDMLRGNGELDYTMFFIAIRELSNLVHITEKEVSQRSQKQNLCVACQHTLAAATPA